MPTTITPRELRRHWIEGREIALIDVREEGPYAESHPLWAVSIPVSELEERLWPLVPRLSVPVVVYDNGEGYVDRALMRIASLGYEDVRILEGGLQAYARAGEVYRDVNSACKAFGELVEAIRHTPSLPASEIKKLLDTEEDLVVLDARRYEEFNTMSIPRGRSCPGGELVYRIRDLVPSPNTQIIVNCAGRTRSIVGTQSLINSGLPNKVMALRNGTIGWTLEGLDLDRGMAERAPKPSEDALQEARRSASKWARHVGVPVINDKQLATFRDDLTRTLYTLDVRDPEEYKNGHPAGFVSAPGGQLVQATDEWVAVRGSRIVLYDDDGVRARMSASWLYQMGWDVFLLDEYHGAHDPSPKTTPPTAELSSSSAITVSELHTLGNATIIDLARSPIYRKGHIPGACFASGPELARDCKAAPGQGAIVLTSADGKIAEGNLADARTGTSQDVFWLAGGTSAWSEAGLPLETECRWLSDPIDVYKRPYEGTDNARENMQAYIDWELQLVAQLANDGVSGFHVARAAA
ncbi:hypothetical protein LTR09_011212 [Extremus antarcticus]|uniref:Rhodanese domain-containing protein n=1 Tax=Extremus antarcticus TaxID=702011 RepID=A0AAJ0D6G0_9PEZI|nr:hypothetical protein LTR09_011212 [Extremus antarcticus]